MAVLSATSEMVRRIQSWRNFGVEAATCILQDAVAWLLEDEEATSADCHRTRDLPATA